ncbi:MAG: hypothetical protein GY715_17680 [Planctomycetes bacterium]|nr:hypothetical protein [Planctomycetota bacterium]
MADAPTTETAGQKKGGLKTAIMVAGMLIGEAALILALMAWLGGEPDVAAAAGPLGDVPAAEDERIVEVLVLDAKLPNAKSGVAYLYSTEVYAQVRQKHADVVADKVQQFYNEIKSEISAVWRTSDPHHFQEPKLENLNRKVNAMLTQRFGADSETDEPVLVKTVIVMGTGFRVDR